MGILFAKAALAPLLGFRGFRIAHHNDSYVAGQSGRGHFS